MRLNYRLHLHGTYGCKYPSKTKRYTRSDGTITNHNAARDCCAVRIHCRQTSPEINKLKRLSGQTARKATPHSGSRKINGVEQNVTDNIRQYTLMFKKDIQRQIVMTCRLVHTYSSPAKFPSHSAVVSSGSFNSQPRRRLTDVHRLRQCNVRTLIGHWYTKFSSGAFLKPQRLCADIQQGDEFI